MKRILSILVLVFLFAQCTTIPVQQNQQPPPFWNEIQQFKKQDSIQQPPKKAILFIGSSSFTIWKNLQQDFPQHSVINRGFGGSEIKDIIYYANDVIYPYDPKQVVIYAGENDIAYSDTITTQHVLNRFKKLFSIIRNKYPDVPVVYVSIKPSITRQNLMPRMVEANNAIRMFLSENNNTVFINVYDKMLLNDGTPDPSIFLEDNLHMNEKGYAIWKKMIESYLLDE